MGKVLDAFGYGYPGAVTRSVDDIVISVRNASGVDIPFGAPVFMTENGAVPFDLESPQEFASFLGRRDRRLARQRSDGSPGPGQRGAGDHRFRRPGRQAVYPQVRRQADGHGRVLGIHGPAGERPHPQSPDRLVRLLRSRRQQAEYSISV